MNNQTATGAHSPDDDDQRRLRAMAMQELTDLAEEIANETGMYLSIADLCSEYRQLQTYLADYAEWQATWAESATVVKLAPPNDPMLSQAKGGKWC